MSTSLLVTLVLAVLIVATAIGVWTSSRRAKPLVGGIGLLLIPVGLYLLGVTDLAVNGVGSLIAWAERTTWDNLMTTGAAMAGGGLLLAIIAGFLPGGRKQEAQAPTQRPVVGAQARPQVGARPAQAQPTKTAGTPSGTGKDGLSAEDREIEELLKKRGIM